MELTRLFGCKSFAMRAVKRSDPHTAVQLTVFGTQQKAGLLLDAQSRTDVTRHGEQSNITSLY
jgi:hypothetical protein